MEIEDFSYIKCTNCGNVMIVPIPYENNHTLLSNMCDEYDELNECCNNPDVLFSTVKYGIENGYIKITDLPLTLRKEFPPEVTHEFNDGEHSLVITKYNGNKVLVYVDGERIIILNGKTKNGIYIGED